jgi:hypothetical protein
MAGSGVELRDVRADPQVQAPLRRFLASLPHTSAVSTRLDGNRRPRNRSFVGTTCLATWGVDALGAEIGQSSLKISFLLGGVDLMANEIGVTGGDRTVPVGLEEINSEELLEEDVGRLDVSGDVGMVSFVSVGGGDVIGS